MITPAFDLSQDPEYLILNIRVPYTRTSEFDLYIDGTDFKFYAKPYFLRWVDQHAQTDATSEVARMQEGAKKAVNLWVYQLGWEGIL